MGQRDSSAITCWLCKRKGQGLDPQIPTYMLNGHGSSSLITASGDEEKGFPRASWVLGPNVCVYTRVRAYPHLCVPENAKTRVHTYMHTHHKHIQAQRKCTEDHMVSVILCHDSNFQ